MSQEDNFWKKAWDDGRTRFHQKEFNLALTKFLSPKNNKTCLVPLCGKSLDLIYLSEHFEKVIGIDIVEMPLLNFFEENNIPYTREGNHFKSDKIDLYQLDFIKDDLSSLGKFDYIYDRASMVAIEPSMREGYCQQIKNLISDQTRLHLITFERENLGGGPPFDIVDDEIQNTFADFLIELLEEDSRVIERNEGEKQKVYRRIYHIEKS